MKKLFLTIVCLFATSFAHPIGETRSDSVSGVYEVMIGATTAPISDASATSKADNDQHPLIRHFALFGFHEVKRAKIDAKRAQAIYGVPSALTSIRLQNGSVDTHGLLRLLIWDKPLGPGVGYAPPETVGQRLAVMMTADIIRVDDVFSDARTAGQPWLAIPPVFADLFGQTEGKTDLHNRRIGVRESAVYGEFVNHVFFQRYGYTIAGYGAINWQSPLKGSEFTHHDFVIRTDIDSSTNYYRDVLGMVAEKQSVADGDWLAGPKALFGMVDGASHYYRGFVSANNICGKLKFFRPRDIRFDRSQHQRVGELGISLHSFYVANIRALHARAKSAGLKPTVIMPNEFAEPSFSFVGPDEVRWQILQIKAPIHPVATQLKIEKTEQVARQVPPASIDQEK